MKRTIGTIIYFSAAAIAMAIYFYIKSTASLYDLQIIRLTDWYALTALFFLYLTLLASPLYSAIPQLPGRTVYLPARKALGISAFLFACLHACLAFFFSLGGFSGLSFLSNNYRAVLALGFTSLTILFLLAIISLDAIKNFLAQRWKILQKFTYLAGVLILAHATLIGSHFVNLGRPIPQLVFLAIFLFLFLESIRIRELIRRKNTKLAFVIWLFILVILLWAYYHLAFSNSLQNFHVH